MPFCDDHACHHGVILLTEQTGSFQSPNEPPAAFQGPQPSIPVPPQAMPGQFGAMSPNSEPDPVRFRRGADVTTVSTAVLGLPWFLSSLGVVWLVALIFPTWLTYVIVVGWVLSGALVFMRPVEYALARMLFKVRPPVGQEALLLTPLWESVLHKAGIPKNQYVLWVEDVEEVNAFAAAGHIVSVTRWSMTQLPSRELEAVLAHELGHHLGGHSWVRLLSLWYSVPARIALRVVKGVTRFVLAVIAAFSIFGWLIAIAVVGFILLFALFMAASHPLTLLLMLMAAAAPVTVAWLGRQSELRADRTAAELGYSQDMLNVFYRWLHQGHDAIAAQAGKRAQLFASHPMVSARIREMEAWRARNPQ